MEVGSHAAVGVSCAAGAGCQPACLRCPACWRWRAADDTDAIQRAIDAASKEASASGQGVAVFMPAGTYRITKKIAMRASRVVLRGSGVSWCWRWRRGRQQQQQQAGARLQQQALPASPGGLRCPPLPPWPGAEGELHHLGALHAAAGLRRRPLRLWRRLPGVSPPARCVACLCAHWPGGSTSLLRMSALVLRRGHSGLPPRALTACCPHLWPL